MPDPMTNALARLLDESLRAWQLPGSVTIVDPGSPSPASLTITTGNGTLHVARAPAGMPFRWVVTAKGQRRRTAASVTGVLRIARQTLTTGYEPQSLRIAAMPVPLPQSQSKLQSRSQP